MNFNYSSSVQSVPFRSPESPHVSREENISGDTSSLELPEPGRCEADRGGSAIDAVHVPSAPSETRQESQG